MGTNVRLLKIHKIPPEVYLESSKSINPIDNAEACFPHDNVVGDHLCDECKKPALPSRLPHARVHFCD